MPSGKWLELEGGDGDGLRRRRRSRGCRVSRGAARKHGGDQRRPSAPRWHRARAGKQAERLRACAGRLHKRHRWGDGETGSMAQVIPLPVRSPVEPGGGARRVCRLCGCRLMSAGASRRLCGRSCSLRLWLVGTELTSSGHRLSHSLRLSFDHCAPPTFTASGKIAAENPLVHVALGQGDDGVLQARLRLLAGGQPQRDTAA